MPEFVAHEAVHFIRRTTAVEDAALRRVRDEVRRQGLPSITPEAGRTLQVLVRLLGARRVLEVGTCLGYSALWLARGLRRGGRLETIDVDAGRAAAARTFLRSARVAARVDTLVGDAHELLPRMRTGAYDLIFLDADKEGMPDYLRQALRLVRPRGVIAADNVFWQGTTFRDDDASPGAAEMRAFVRAAAGSRRLATTILPLGDGLLVAVKA